MNDILTVEEVAALLKISRRAVYALTREASRRVQSSPIPIIRVSPKCVRFSRQSVELWLREREERR